MIDNGADFDPGITSRRTARAVEGALLPVTIRITAVNGNVQGHVFAADGITPVAGAYLQALNGVDGAYMTETYADAGGAYQFTNLLPGAAGLSFAPTTRGPMRRRSRRRGSSTPSESPRPWTFCCRS